MAESGLMEMILKAISSSTDKILIVCNIHISIILISPLYRGYCLFRIWVFLCYGIFAVRLLRMMEMYHPCTSQSLIALFGHALYVIII